MTMLSRITSLKEEKEKSDGKIKNYTETNHSNPIITFLMAYYSTLLPTHLKHDTTSYLVVLFGQYLVTYGRHASLNLYVKWKSFSEMI